MREKVEVAVIGGGIVGCCILYHLAKLGIENAVLIERKELTAGSSWHAAGGYLALNADTNMSALQSYTIQLYSEIEAFSGQSIGQHHVGGISFAATESRWESLRALSAQYHVLGIESELLSPSEIAEAIPFLDPSTVLGGIYDPHHGYLDPSGTTFTFAKAAQKFGAEIYRYTKVEALKQTRDDGWIVHTNKGDIEAKHVINAAGLWAREVAEMVGVYLPLIPMEHHYLITEDLPSMKNRDRPLPVIVDLDGEMYLREEHDGVLLGVYESPATPWAVDGTSWNYAEDELLIPKLDSIEHSLEIGFRRFPEIADAGIKRIVNGPFTFTPDGNPLVGPVHGVKNYWAACGVMAGFSQCGGIGLTLAQWIKNGEPKGNPFAMDTARFGGYANAEYTETMARQFYERRFRLAYPNETWPASRPLEKPYLYDSFVAQGAVFSVSYGKEMPMYFADNTTDTEEIPSFRRSNAFPHVARECTTVRDNVGALELAGFSKYRVFGADVHRYLNRLLACTLPEIGRVKLAPMCNRQGYLMGDLTIFRLSEDSYMLGGSAYLQNWHMRWFNEQCQHDSVTIENLTDTWGGVTIAGPKSRILLQRLTNTDCSNSALPFMSVQKITVAELSAWVGRLSVTGELGYEIYVDAGDTQKLYDALAETGTDLGFAPFGVYALNSLRLEKGFGTWQREFSSDYGLDESGLSRFVNWNKDFIGKQAALQLRKPARKLHLLAIEATDSDAWGFEPIWSQGKYIGFTTSGGYGHYTGLSLALGYIDVGYDTSNLTVQLLGEHHPARILETLPHDPSSLRLKS